MTLLRTSALALLFALGVGLVLFDGGDAGDGMDAPCRDPGGSGRPAAPVREDWRTDPGAFIAHGGGGIDGRTYTGSHEAVASSIGRGYRMIELDLLVTSDGFLVAAHDWKSFRERTGDAPSAVTDKPLALAEFRARKIDGRYTPLDEAAIRAIFLKHADLILVTDKIRDFPRLVKAFPFQERVIVEVFSAAEIPVAMAAGVVNPMLSIGNLEASLDLVLAQPVGHVALSTNELQRCPGAARRIVESGRRVFAFSTDDAGLMARHVGTHVSAFYSDNWHVAKGRCEGAACPGPPWPKGDDR